jgi:carboxypeptidase Taq
MSDAYRELIDRVRDIHRLHAVEALLDWDQETYMPDRGIGPRAEGMSVIAGLAHEQLTCERMATLLDTVSDCAEDAVMATNIRETRRAYLRASRLPTSLVKTITETSTLAKDAWARARAADDFKQFAPPLSKLIDLKREVAERIGYDTEPYDALMDEFEPGATSATIAPLFDELAQRTSALLKQLQSASNPPDNSILHRHFPAAQQATLSRQLAEHLCFDFEAGRIDVSVHPFCTTIGGPSDVRITTRYHEDSLPSAMYGTLHETGHALYEQGLLAEHVFTPMGEAVSLGIHESQSRMWENFVGRSRPFLEHHYPAVQALFPEALGSTPLNEFYRAINAVAPSLIRIEADELTYNLHIVLRFQIERALIRGELQVQDVPAAWNDTMTTLVGVAPPNDADGCMQDIHWSMGAFGYFPTYALGNLYAAQFFEAAREALPDLESNIAANDHRPLVEWLRTHIHTHGQRYRASELVERISGAPLSIEPFMRYVTEKFSAVYGL